jgi:hypothetical protein
MRSTLATLIFLFPMLMAAACDQDTLSAAADDQGSVVENSESMGDTLVISVGDKEFTAVLLGNPTATSFRAMLPLTMRMTELNGNEKYFRLPKNLPTDELNPGTIKQGDLMLYGSDTFVLFYKAFSTSYSYTKLGRITDTTGLIAALGTGTITVSISLK